MLNLVRSVVITFFCTTLAYGMTVPILDIDFGQSTTPLQPGFTTSATGEVGFAYEAIDDLPIRNFFFEGDNVGPFGALVSDGLWFPDDFVASQSGVSFGVYYTVSGLDPDSTYEVTVYTPPDEGLNNFSVRGEQEGVLVSTEEFLDSATYELRPDLMGEITGDVSSATGPSAWSGISVRLQVPEPTSAAFVVILFTTVASGRSRHRHAS